jgi:hypothetical protein
LLKLASFPVEIKTCDINANMLEVGKHRSIERGIPEKGITKINNFFKLKYLIYN